MNNNKEHDSKTVAKKKNTTTTNEMPKNRFKDISLKEYIEIANKIEAHNYNNPELEMIRNCLIELKESILLCKACGDGEVFEYHDARARYHFNILRQYRWFNELIEKENSKFNYPKQQTKQAK